MKYFLPLFFLIFTNKQVDESQEYDYIFCDDFTYNTFEDFKSNYVTNSYLFKRLLPEDLDGDKVISEQEKVRMPDIKFDEVSSSNVLQIRLKNNNFPKKYTSSKGGGYGNYLRRSELMLMDTLNQGKIIRLDYKVNLKQFLLENKCYRENKDIITQILVKGPVPKNLKNMIEKPIFALAIVENQWKVYLTEFNKKKIDTSYVIDSSVDVNKWIKFSIEFKVSAKKNAHVKIWKDDVLVFEKSKYKNSPSDILSYRVKCGLYKPNINTCSDKTVIKYNQPETDRILYFDNICLKVKR